MTNRNGTIKRVLPTNDISLANSITTRNKKMVAIIVEAMEVKAGKSLGTAFCTRDEKKAIKNSDAATMA